MGEEIKAPTEVPLPAGVDSTPALPQGTIIIPVVVRPIAAHIAAIKLAEKYSATPMVTRKGDTVKVSPKCGLRGDALQAAGRLALGVKRHVVVAFVATIANLVKDKHPLSLATALGLWGELASIASYWCGLGHSGRRLAECKGEAGYARIHDARIIGLVRYTRTWRKWAEHTVVKELYSVHLEDCATVLAAIAAEVGQPLSETTAIAYARAMARWAKKE